MTAPRLAFVLSIGALAIGCINDRDHPDSLGEVDGLQVAIHAGLDDDRAGGLSIVFDGETCLQASGDLRAELVGAETLSMTPGDSDDAQCANPVIVLGLSERSRIAGQRLVVGDDTHSVEIDLADALVPRSVRLSSPADGVVRRGERLELAWSPASDVQRGSFSAFIPGPVAHELTLRAEGEDRLGATMPAEDLGRTSVSLTITASPDARPLSCDGARCNVTVVATELLTVGVAP